MFGFLIGGIVNDDAVKLKTFTEMALGRYGALSTAELQASIEKDFDEGHRYIDRSSVSFQFNELSSFLFMFDEMAVGGNRSLSALRQGKYAGFILNVSDGDRWHCSVSDGIAYRATGGAKKLAKVMDKKFGVSNFSNLIGKDY